MRVSDFITRFGPEFMDLEASGVAVVAVTPGSPTVASTIPPEGTLQPLKMIAEDGDWSTAREIKPN